MGPLESTPLDQVATDVRGERLRQSGSDQCVIARAACGTGTASFRSDRDGQFRPAIRRTGVRLKGPRWNRFAAATVPSFKPFGVDFVVADPATCEQWSGQSRR